MHDHPLVEQVVDELQQRAVGAVEDLGEVASGARHAGSPTKLYGGQGPVSVTSQAWPASSPDQRWTASSKAPAPSRGIRKAASSSSRATASPGGSRRRASAAWVA